MTTGRFFDRRSGSLHRLSMSGVARSEWIKLRSLRSTSAAFALMLVLQLGIGLVMTVMTVNREGIPSDAPLSEIPGLSTIGATIGVLFGQLIVSVLGVLVMSSEYSSGQIRTSFIAVPNRVPVLWAKAVVFTFTSFVVSLTSIVLAYFLTEPLLAGAGVSSDLLSPDVYWTLIGAAVYLSLTGVLALGLAAILRRTAPSIAAALGLLIVLPTLLAIVPAHWAASASSWLPSSAGTALYRTDTGFHWWHGLIIMLAWDAASLATAALFIHKRDA